MLTFSKGFLMAGVQCFQNDFMLHVVEDEKVFSTIFLSFLYNTFTKYAVQYVPSSKSQSIYN